MVAAKVNTGCQMIHMNGEEEQWEQYCHVKWDHDKRGKAQSQPQGD
jgi:hypothetical protein